MNKNFDKICELAQKDFSESDIINILKSDNDIEKPIVILNISSIDNDEILDLLIYHLTNHDGPIREATAFTISELITKNPDLFQKETILNQFLKAFIDVNPNVVRYILNSIKYINDKKYLYENTLDKINELYSEFQSKPRRGKVEEHIYTKKCFKIYWLLEALKTIIICDDSILYENAILKNDFKDVIIKLSTFEEYTIREKIAQIVNILDIEDFSQIKKVLKNDGNYFVKRQ